MGHSEQITFAIVFHSDDYSMRIDCPESTWNSLINVLESKGFLSSGLLRWELAKSALTVVGEKSMTRELLGFLLAQRFVGCNVSIAYGGTTGFVEGD